MCGICGYFGEVGDDSTTLLRVMQTALQHRGPDSTGMYRNQQYGCAVSRLSIVDIEGSDQPIFNEDKNVALIYNGMIYNYQELRAELESKGHRFRTNGDGEVIIHLFEEEGTGAFNRLHGMFAIALYEQNQKRVTLARDHFGIKPLFYYNADTIVLFASEIKALIRTGYIPNNIDFSGLDLYFSYNYIPGETTLYEHVSELLPGCYIQIVAPLNIKSRRYWQLKEHSSEQKTACISEHIKHLNALMEESVQKHLRSDVEVGCFLSGGIDSGALVHYISKQLTKPLKTFTVGFDDSFYDESTNARSIADYYKTTHIDIMCTPQSVIDFLEHDINSTGKPVGDQSIVATSLVSRLAREHVKVCFSGDGADELFGGYSTYVADYLFQYMRLVPSVFLKLCNYISRRMPESDKNISLRFMAMRFFEGCTLEHMSHAHAYWRSIFDDSGKRQLFKYNTEHLMPEKKILEQYYQFFDDSSDDISSCLAADVTVWLPFNNLMRVDMSSMKSGLEVRVPYVHLPLVEYITSLPASVRCNVRYNKRLLRSVLAAQNGYVFKHSQKRGWHMPIAYWLKNNLFDYVYERFQQDNVLFDRYINRDECIRLLVNHKEQRENNCFKLWGILSLLNSVI